LIKEKEMMELAKETAKAAGAHFEAGVRRRMRVRKSAERTGKE